MESHESWSALKTMCERYPRHSQSLFQTYNDILYTQKWVDIAIEDVPAAERAVVSGRKSAEETERKVVAPCSLSESLSIEWLNTIFNNFTPGPDAIWVGIVSDDSSVVYYKLSKGIVKPPL